MIKKGFQFPLEYLWVATVLVGIFAFVNTHPIRPQDFWFHITIGKTILATGQIPSIDTFSHTAAGMAYPSYNTYWLMEVTQYQIYQWGGAALTVFFHSLIITGSYAIIFLTNLRATQNLRAAAFGTLFAAGLGLSDWNVRPQAIAFLIGATFLFAINEIRRTTRWHWLFVFPIGLVLWVNSHGSYVLGIVLVGSWVAVELWEYWQQRKNQSLGFALAALLLTGLCSLLNPRGIGVFQYSSGMASNSVIQNMVPEWASPTFDTINGFLFLCGFLAAVLILFISPKRPSTFQIILFLGFGVLGLKTLRGSIWFGLFLAPTIADHFSSLLKSWFQNLNQAKVQSSSNLLNGIVVIFLGFLLILSLPWFKEQLPYPPLKAGLLSSETPIEATQALLDASWPTEIFNSMSFGSYLIWASQPEYPVFVDSRIELYPPEIWRDYLSIGAALPGWDDLLKQYSIHTLMLNYVDQANLIKAVEVDPNWVPVYQDSTAVIFVRNRYSE
jgi:hypothetical protein